MLKLLNKGEILYKRGYLGEFCPYYYSINGQTYYSDNFPEIVEKIPQSRRILDPVALMSLVSFNYINGDRTLIKDLKRIPWHSQLFSDGSVVRLEPIRHYNLEDNNINIAKKLIDLLYRELKQACGGRKEVWILLTGGLDSRVTAGLLKRFQAESNVKVNAATWGDIKSRDYVYARRIANFYNWDFHHIPLDSKILQRNILDIAYYGGAEIAGMHLHGASFFKNLKDQLVLASSFGDSIGRGEFSGVHLAKLKISKASDPYHIVYKYYAGKLQRSVDLDIGSCFNYINSNNYYEICELDMQENYMRRMISQAMDPIRATCTLYQMFTSSDVVKYMWSLDQICRTDDIYKELFRQIDEKLYNLPWARNGIAPSGLIETDKNLRKNYHDYELWLCDDLYGWASDILHDGKLEKLDFINTNCIYKLLNLLKKKKAEFYSGTSEMLFKLIGIVLLINNFNIKPSFKSNPKIYIFKKAEFMGLCIYDKIKSMVKLIFNFFGI